MDIKELTWLRANTHKFDKNLRSQIITNYRNIKKKPCIFHPLIHLYNKRFKKIPVLIQFCSRSVNKFNLPGDNDRILNKKSHKLDIINSVSAKLTLKEIKKIADQQSITKIYYDHDVHSLLNYAVPATNSNHLWNHNISGKDITIAFMDTGIILHPDFIMPKNKILAFKDFTDKKRFRSAPYDDNGHGTHCASAACGNGYASDGKYKGPAFNADLVALKVLDKLGTGKASQLIQGFQWCLENKNKYNIKVISLSLGYQANNSYKDDPVCQAMEYIWRQGLVVCTAAGNDGPDLKSINAPGIHPRVITVGASDDKNTLDVNDDDIADFSSRGPTIDGLTKPDLIAPGANIIAARAKGSVLDLLHKNDIISNWYISLSGTSMATPICAGIVAQLLETNPTLTPDEVKDILLKNCRKSSNIDSNIHGHGYLDATKFSNQQK